MKAILRNIVFFSVLLAVAIVADVSFDVKMVVKDAEARLGRPLTPISVAGVARRTTRRVIRRSTVYVATLPAACSSIVIEGMSLYQCGATYYQPYGNQYVVVYID